MQPFLLTITAKRHCLFHSFSSSEAKEYLNKRNILIDPITAKSITKFNPMLMSALPPNIEYSIEIEKSIKSHIILYLRNLLHSLIQLKSMENWLQNQLLGTIKWIDLSENQVPLSDQEEADFLGSWVYTQGLCIIHQKFLKFNFLWVATLLLKELSGLSTDKVIPKNPIINGYIFEERFFKEIE